ncbi:MAG: bifunctional metallophosphatase/5'-nucleotidase [Elusimicrobiaceae bacterium]|nr:bifunctional metallophosphatase/5'-nucleotidase [Elusimicrobiaceae bacterium]
MKKLITVVLLLCAAFAAWAGEVKIFHTSDVHGFYFPTTANGKTIGGFAALAGYLDTQKKPYLLLDSGDFTSGTYEAKKSKGAYSVDFINKLGYNAVTLGNHENDFKDDALLKNIADIKADILVLNAEDRQTKTYPEHIKPYAFYNINGYKIAVIGVGKEFSTPSKYIKINKSRKLLKKTLPEVRKENPNAVVLLIHDSAQDQRHEDAYTTVNLVKGLGIDLVLGGHAHVIIQNMKSDGTVFAESGTALKGITVATLTFDDKTKKLNNVKTEYVEMDNSKIKLSKDMEAFADKRLDKKMNIVVGKAKENISNLPGTKNGAVDSPLGDLFCDIIKQNTGAEICVINSGAVRGTGILAGNITNRVVEEVLPFQNKIMSVKADGKFIEKLVRKSLKESSSLFQYSGLKVKYSFKNNRAKINEILVNGKPLEYTKTYTLAVPDFIANGNSEGYLFKKITDKKVISDTFLADYFVKYIKENKDGIVPPANVERIIKVSK